MPAIVVGSRIKLTVYPVDPVFLELEKPRAGDGARFCFTVIGSIPRRPRDDLI